MIALATAEKELFENNGLAGTLLEELGAQVTLLEEATQAAFAGRRGHTGARAQLKVVCTPRKLLCKGESFTTVTIDMRGRSALPRRSNSSWIRFPSVLFRMTWMRTFVSRISRS